MERLKEAIGQTTFSRTYLNADHKDKVTLSDMQRAYSIGLKSLIFPWLLKKFAGISRGIIENHYSDRKELHALVNEWVVNDYCNKVVRDDTGIQELFAGYAKTIIEANERVQDINKLDRQSLSRTTAVGIKTKRSLFSNITKMVNLVNFVPLFGGRRTR